MEPRWQICKGGGRQFVGNASNKGDSSSNSRTNNNAAMAATLQQLEQLMKLLPPPSKSGNGGEYDEDTNLNYYGVACCF